MTRRGRIVEPGLPHHIIIRANNRRRLFTRTRDYELFIELLEKALKKTSCQLHSLTLMTNHVHAIVTAPTKEALAQFVASVSQPYALRRNRARAGSGKLFEERYKRWPLKTEIKLAVATTYCDANPLRAGMVQDPRDYPWSTCALHAGEPGRARIPERIWTPSPFYLALGATPEERARRYVEVLGLSIGLGLKPEDSDEIDAIEERSAEPYTRRLERPDRTRAADPSPPYAAKLRGGSK